MAHACKLTKSFVWNFINTDSNESGYCGTELPFFICLQKLIFAYLVLFGSCIETIFI